MSFSITFEEPIVSISLKDALTLIAGTTGDFSGWENGNGHFLELPKMSVYHDGELHVYTQFDDIEWIVDDASVSGGCLVLRSVRFVPGYEEVGFLPECEQAGTVVRRTILRIPIEGAER